MEISGRLQGGAICHITTDDIILELTGPEWNRLWELGKFAPGTARPGGAGRISGSRENLLL